LKPSSDKPKQNSTYFFSQHGSDFEPQYALRHPDPDQHASKNRYAAAISDAFNPDVLYAEVLLIPEWTQPSLNVDQTRGNGGVPPPPEPILPTEFVIQLYNPDQQIMVKHKPASWNTAASWEFEMPQQTFRAPSSSALDRGQNDPAASDITPRIGFKWKKDGKLSKDLACFLSGRTVDADGSKKKSKEPDITIAIFKALKEVTLYEPNLVRVDIEDAKGLEVVLLLSIVVIRDVYFGSMKDAFNLPEGGRKASVTSGRPQIPGGSSAMGSPSQPPPGATAVPGRDPRVPPTDPRSQWDIDAETARLWRQAAEEERRRKKQEEEQERQLRNMLEAEDKEARRKQAEIDRETERLARLYGQPSLPYRPHSGPAAQRPTSVYDQSAYLSSQAPHHQQSTSWGSYNAGPYMSGAATQSGFLSPTSQQHRLKNKSSIFSFRRNSEDPNKLQKKRSAIF
jgi:hypothetical protein